MASVKWQGTADAVAQVDTFQITAVSGTPSDTSYIITINTDTVAVDGDTDVDTTAAALQVALEASTNPYFSSIAWTVTTDTITATANAAGDPNTFTTSVVGGTGTISGLTSVAASSGPNDWDVARNWDTGVVPVSTDDVIIEDGVSPITHGLDQSAVTLTSLTIRKSYTGIIGLKEKEFATSSDGKTTTAVKEEYRDQYLQISVTTLVIGEDFTGVSQDGSTLIKIDLGSIVSDVTVHDTASTTFEAKLPAIQLLGTNVSNTLQVRAARSSVGIAVRGFEVSTFSDVDIGSDLSSGGVILGPGVTLTNWTQKSGINNIEAAATITKIDCLGGTLTTEGDYTVTTINVGDSGEYFSNHEKSGGVAITTLNFISLGTVNALKSSLARTWTTVNLFSEATLNTDDSIVTITTLNRPSGESEIVVS